MRCGAADHAIVTNPATSLLETVRELNGGQGVQIVFEAVGGTDCEPLRQGVNALAPGGTLCILGAYLGDVSLAYREANNKEIAVRWSNGYASWNGRREFQIALEWLGEGRVAAAPLITHTYPLAEISEAFRVAVDRRVTGAIKVQVEP